MATQPEPPPDDQAEDEWDSVEFAAPPAEPPASAPAASSVNLSPPDFLALGQMREEDLKSLAKAVLSEFERRSPDPRDLSFPYRDVVAELHRRLGEARAEARSGFGLRTSQSLPIAKRLLVRHAKGEELSEEMKAQVMETLAAELMREDGSSDSALPWTEVAAPGSTHQRCRHRGDGCDGPRARRPQSISSGDQRHRRRTPAGHRKRGAPAQATVTVSRRVASPVAVNLSLARAISASPPQGVGDSVFATSSR